MEKVASGAVTSIVKPQAENPGAIPEKCTSQQPQSADGEDVQQTLMTAETFSNLLEVGNLEENDISHQPPPPVPSYSNDRCVQGRYKQSEHMFATRDQVASGIVTSVVKPAPAKHPGAIPKKRTSPISQGTNNEDLNVQQTQLTAKTFSSPVPVSGLEASVSSQEQLTSKPIRVESTKPASPVPSNRNCPSWGLPLPEEDKRTEDMFDAHQQTETPPIKNISQISATAGQDSITQSDQAGLPPRPRSPEEGSNSPRNEASLVTGRPLRACGRSRSENLKYQQSRNQAEHNDEMEIHGQILKENDIFCLTTTYLLEDNTKLKQECRQKCTENVDLKQQLEANSAKSEEQLAQIAVLAEENEQLKNSSEEQKLMISDDHEMIRKCQQMLFWKSQECDSLKETIRNLRMVIDELVCRNRGFRNNTENKESLESDYLELPGSASFNLLQNTGIDMENRTVQQLAERMEPSIPECNDSSFSNNSSPSTSDNDVRCGVGVGVDGDGCDFGCGGSMNDRRCGVGIDGGGGDGRCDADGDNNGKCCVGVHGDDNCKCCVGVAGGGSSDDSKCGVDGDGGGGGGGGGGGSGGCKCGFGVDGDGKCCVDEDDGCGSDDGKCCVDEDDGCGSDDGSVDEGDGCGSNDGKCGVDEDDGCGSDDGKCCVDENDGCGSDERKCCVDEDDGCGSDECKCGVVHGGGSDSGRCGVGVDEDDTGNSNDNKCVDGEDGCGSCNGKCVVDGDGGSGGSSDGKHGVGVDGDGGSDGVKSAVDGASGGADDRCGIGVWGSDGNCGVVVDGAGGGSDGGTYGGGGCSNNGRSAVNGDGGGFDDDKCDVVWDGGGGDDVKCDVCVDGDGGSSNDGKCDVADGGGGGDGRYGVGADVANDGSDVGNCDVGVVGDGCGNEDGKCGALGSVGSSIGGSSSQLSLKLVASVKPFHENNQFQDGVTSNNEDHNSLLDLGPCELQEGDLC